jgi:hypothetical protein
MADAARRELRNKGQKADSTRKPLPSQTAEGLQIRESTMEAKQSQAQNDRQRSSGKQRWTAEESALLLELRQKGLELADISKQFPGRSVHACRSHLWVLDKDKDNRIIEGNDINHRRSGSLQTPSVQNGQCNFRCAAAT